MAIRGGITITGPSGKTYPVIDRTKTLLKDPKDGAMVKFGDFGRRGRTEFLVFHHTAGRGIDSTINTLIIERRLTNVKTPQGLSYTYIVAQDGTIHQCVDDANIAQHGANTNGVSIGISAEARNDADVSPAQRDSMIGLGRFLQREYNLPANAVYGHGEVATNKGEDEGRTVANILRNGGPPPQSQYLLSSRSEVYRRAGAVDPASGQVTTLPTLPAAGFDAYYKKVYVDPISSNGGKEEEITKALKEGKLFARYDSRTESSSTLQTLQDVVRDTAIYENGPNSLDGELRLLGSISQVGQEYKNERSSVLNRVDGLLPAEAVFLVQNKLFEFYPDLMRQKMSENSKGDGYNSNYSHAWRSPGKLAVTADITIPGASGFRIGQVFWIGRTYDNYKKFGAFQLFGLTETIDISKGWTTEIHSRFNVIPLRKLQGLEAE